MSRVVLALVLALAPAAAADVEAVRACVEANAPKRSAVQTVTLSARDESGSLSEARLKLYWLRMRDGERRVLIRFEAPEDLARVALLVQAPPEGRPRVHLYLPDIGKAQAVYSRDQVEGLLGQGGIGVAELERLLDPVGGQELRLLEESSTLEGRPVWVVEARQMGMEEDPLRVVTWVDQEYCLPLRTEFYGGDDRLHKRLLVDPEHVQRVAQSWMPRRLEVDNPEKGVQSVLRIESVEVDIPLAPSLLTVKALAQGS